MAAESAMTAMPIVVVQPARERRGSMGRTGERRAVGPLPQHGANEPFGLAVGPGRVRTGASVVKAQRLGGGAEYTRPVPGTVIGEDALDADAAPVKPAHGSTQECRDGQPLLVAEHLGIGHARAVVDADVRELPTDAPRLAMTVASDPMAHVPDAAELLDIPMQQLPGPRPFVPHPRWPRGERLQAGQAELAQRAGDSRAADLHHFGDLRPRPAEVAQALDLDHQCRGDGARRPLRPTRAVGELARRRARRPFPGRPVTDTKGPGDGGHGLAGVNALSNQGSTPRRGPGILVHVHPRSLHRTSGRLATTTFAERSRMDNLLRHKN